MIENSNNSDWSAQALRDRIGETLGIRLSPRLHLASELIHVFCDKAEFGRKEVIAEVGDTYDVKTIDRVLSSLEAGSAIKCVERNISRQGGGAVYRVQPFEMWHKIDTSIVKQRSNRSKRGSGKRGVVK